MADTDSGATTGIRPRTLHAGDVVGSYRILRLIGCGGMGEVYEAERSGDGSPQLVALKTIRSDRADDDDARRRFKRECELLARLDHPGIARTYGAGTDDGVAWLTMELLRGQTLAQRLTERGPLELSAAIDLFRQLTPALAHAHANGITHRDLKPSNVFFDGMRVILTDFGVARLSSPTASVSESGVAVGTPAYLSPEQVLGEPVTPASDIYAMAVVLFEVLTGRLPFEGDTSLAQAVARVLRDPLSLATCRPDLPPALAGFVERCLARTPASRPATAEAFLLGLEASSRPAAHRLVSRRHFVTALAAATAGGAWVQHSRAPARDAEVSPFFPVAPMRDGRDGHTATVLPNGAVLIAGGTNGAALDTAETYDPAIARFRPTGRMLEVRRAHTATLTGSGAVLIAGGDGRRDVLRTSEIYDPGSGTFLRAAPMTSPRDAHTATALPDGRILVTGGGYAKIRAQRTSELFDEPSRSFTPGPEMKSARFFHAAVPLQEGRVLLVAGWGGEPHEAFTILNRAEIYDPRTDRFEYTEPLHVRRYAASATLLRDGRVLVVGGNGPANSIHATAEIYDSRAGRFSELIPMLAGRVFHTATLMSDGRVLVTGGQIGAEVEQPAEIFDPVANRFEPAGAMTVERYGHVAALLPSGGVLLAGGVNRGFLASAEVFHPGRIGESRGTLIAPAPGRIHINRIGRRVVELARSGR